LGARRKQDSHLSARPACRRAASGSFTPCVHLSFRLVHWHHTRLRPHCAWCLRDNGL
jgi:hypothetical protein